MCLQRRGWDICVCVDCIHDREPVALTSKTLVVFVHARTRRAGKTKCTRNCRQMVAKMHWMASNQKTSQQMQQQQKGVKTSQQMQQQQKGVSALSRMGRLSR